MHRLSVCLLYRLLRPNRWADPAEIWQQRSSPDWYVDVTTCMAWSSMNFRQRMGWICLASYLLASLALAHYIFDVSIAYSSLTLAHASLANPAPSSLPWRLLSWTLSLPLSLWIFVIITLYLQVFCFLVSCTRTNPKTMGYFLLPLCLIMMCRSRHPAIKEYRPGIGMSL